MPTIHIVDAGGGANAGNLYFAAYNNDFNYNLPRGAERWLALWKYNPDITASYEGPAMFKSTDSGATWALQNDGSAPSLSVGLPVPLAYDSRMNILNPASETKISMMYASYPETVIAFTSVTSHLHMIDFTFGSGYGSPYGALDITNTFPNAVIGQFSFSSLPSGNKIVVYNKDDGAGTCAYQFYTGSWSGENVISAAVGNTFTNLAVDSSGNSHVIINDPSSVNQYYRINSSGAVVAGPIAVTSSGIPANLSIIDGNLVLLINDGTGFTIATGAPAATPTWTTETITGLTVSSGNNSAWLQKITAAYAVDLEISGNSGSAYDYTVDFAQSAVSGYTIHWVDSSFPANNIYRVVKSGTWGSPTSLWTPAPSVARQVFSIVARSAGGATSGNKSRSYYQ